MKKMCNRKAKLHKIHCNVSLLSLKCGHYNFLFTELQKDSEKGSPVDESVSLPPPVPNQRCENGICEWDDVQLSPAPPMYRPFIAMEEAAKGGGKRTAAKPKIGR